MILCGLIRQHKAAATGKHLTLEYLANVTDVNISYISNNQTQRCMVCVLMKDIVLLNILH